MEIFYLEPKGLYKSPLRSDTLWGAICWSIRLLYGKDELEKLISSYENPAANPFIISSAFPFLKKGGEKITFFPIPLKKGRVKSGVLSISDYREKKGQKKRVYLSKADFEAVINGGGPVYTYPSPKEKAVTVTHNTIDRINFGTLSINGQGQLFHEEELYLKTQDLADKAGLFFLAKGDTRLLKGALRFLAHYGIGGNRSSGKGAFDISFGSFTLNEPKDANARMNLSLYHPLITELKQYKSEIQDKPKPPPYYYKLEVRQGKVGAMHSKFKEKKPKQMFKEGSVFPLIKANRFGQNPEVAEIDHKIRLYGMGFMVNIKQ